VKLNELLAAETSGAELDEEVRAHLEMATQERVERGVDQKEAERAARVWKRRLGERRN
jgi:hypothetical protein